MMHLLEVWLWLSPAEVGEGPGGVPEHGELGVVPQLHEEGNKGFVTQDQVATGWRVSCNVAQSPDSLQAKKHVL